MVLRSLRPIKFLKEPLQFINYSLLLLRSGSTAEPGYRGHQFVDVGAAGAHFAIAEGILHEFPGFRSPELLRLDDLRQLLLLLLGHIAVPLRHHIIHVVDAGQEGLNQLLLAPQFRAGVNGLLDGDENLLVLSMGVVVLGHQQQNVVDVDLSLADQLRLKHNVVIDVFLVGGAGFFLPLIPEILIPTQIVLQIPFRQQLLLIELVKGQQQIPHPQHRAEQRDEFLLGRLAAADGLRQGELLLKLFDQIHIAGSVLAGLVGVAQIIVLEFLQQHNASSVFVAEPGQGGVHPLLQVPETDNIAEPLDPVQNPVGAAEGLDQAVHFQIFVHPKGVQGGGVEAGQEHVDHDEQVQLIVLHPQGHVFIVILELFPGGVVVGVEHLVVVLNGLLQKISAALVQGAGVLRILLPQHPLVLQVLVGPIAVNQGHPQPLGRVRLHLALELLVVELGHGHRGHREDGVEAAEPLPGLDLLNGAAFAGGHLGNVGQHVELIAPAAPVGFLVEVVQNVAGHQLNALGGHKSLFPVDVPHLFIVYVRVIPHGTDVVHPEGEHILVIDGVDNGVGVELIPKGLLCGQEPPRGRAGGVDGEDGGAGEAENVILLEVLDNGLVHVTELAPVALVKDHHHMLLIDRVAGVFLDEGGQLLNGGDDDPGIGVGELPGQNGGGGVAVGGPLLEPVILLHGLVVQILPVHHKEHLVYVGQQGGQPGSFEGGQGFAAAGGVPDIAAAGDGAVFLVVGGDLDAVQNALGGGDLIGPHHHQHLFRSEHAVAGEHVEQGVPGEEGPGKIHQIRQIPVMGVGPEAGELEAAAGLGLPGPLVLFCLPDGAVPGGVGIVLGVGAVGDHKDLDVLIEAAARPEGVPLIAVDLLKGLPEGDAPALELHMDQGQAVDQDGHVVAVVVAGPLVGAHGVLMDDLEMVVVDLLFVDEGDVFGGAVVPVEHLDKILLDLAGLFQNVLVGVGNDTGEELIPLAVGELVAVQGLQLPAQVGDQIRLLVDGQILIALLLEHPEKFLLQGSLALVLLGAEGGGGVFRDHGVFRGGGDDVEEGHDSHLLL